jgi:hypothetical protein
LEQYSPEEKKQILWESLRRRAILMVDNALGVLGSEEVKRWYLASSEKKSPEEYFVTIHENSRAFIEISHKILRYDPLFTGIGTPLRGKVATFPYDCLEMTENIPLSTILVNIGHDLTHLPGFTHPIYELVNRLKRLEAQGKEENQKEEKKFYYQVLPLLYQGLVWDFEVFKQALEGRFPQEERVDLENILKTESAEAAVRARAYGSPVYLDRLVLTDGEGKKIKVETNIEKGLNLPGNETALHLLFYQMVKNATVLLEESESVSEGVLEIAAKNLSINGQELVAVRIQDNGQGIDIASILKAKQRLLKESGQSLTPLEQRIVGDWTALDLRIIDVVNFIFERRVSGEERTGLHGGIGLTMAKEIIDKHGGCVWVTNLSGQPGAKFLVLLDPSSDGSLRRNLPALFQTETIPAKILEEIDRGLSVVTSPSP